MGDRVLRYGERIPQSERIKASNRYHVVTRAINKAFWGTDSEIAHSLYVGSYGRNTAIETSDIDILLELPDKEFDHFNNLSGNSQSRLLQALREAVKEVYPKSDIRADGQVVKINFSDGMFFELLPVFKNKNYFGDWDGTYKYPDSNSGGKWRSTNPKAEQEAMRKKNKSSNGLLYDTCRHMRNIRDSRFSSYHLSGIVIDSFVYAAIGSWRWLDAGETATQPSGTYEKILLEYFNKNKSWGMIALAAPGSGESVSTAKSIECLEKVLKYMAQ